MANIKLIERKPPKKPEVDLSKEKILIVDNGLMVMIAEHCAKYYGQVWYCKPVAAAFLESSQHIIGRGIDGVEWVPDFHEYVDKATVLAFVDVNFAPDQIYYKKHGYNVCGALAGEEMELNKHFFITELHKAGLPVPKTWEFEGLDETWQFLKNKHEKLWIKAAERYRSDWETDYHDNPFMTEIILNEKRAELGVHRANNIKLLVQRNVPDCVEIGRDGPFMLNGDMPKNGFVGIEDKAQLYFGKVFEDPPSILQDITEKLKPAYKRLGFQGIYSNEVRITKEGKAYPMDDCCRAPNPPTSVLLEVYGESYARALYDLAHGKMPVLKPKYKYGAEIILSSSFHERHELHVSVPKDLKRWVKFRNVTKRDNGELYCVENKAGGHYGSVVAVGNDSPENICNEAEERAKELKIYRTEYCVGFWDKMKPELDKAREYAKIDLY